MPVGQRKKSRHAATDSARAMELKERKVSTSRVTFAQAAKRFWLPVVLIAALASIAGPAPAQQSQAWTWTPETVDKTGKAMKIKVDTLGNVHLSYGTDDGVWKYAFQAAGTKRWDTMDVGPGGVSYLDLTLDKDQSPVMCETYRVLRYAKLVGSKWIVQELDTDGAPIGFGCAIAVAPDGTPHITWYKEKGADHVSPYLHLKYASLEEGVWLIHTLDFDTQTGKWDSIAVDSKGVPHAAYDSFVDGRMKYAVRTGTGKDWDVQVVDGRKMNDVEYNYGMGNSLVLDAQGHAHIAYYTTHSMRYAAQTANGWDVHVIADAAPLGSWLDFRSSIVLDKAGYPHVAYQDGAAIKHAWFDGKAWHVQIVIPPGSDENRYPAMAIDQNDHLYLAYRDPTDKSVKVAVGVRSDAPQTAIAAPVKPGTK